MKSARVIQSAMIAFALLSAPALASEGDAEKGMKVYKKCAACHKVGEGAKNSVGPVLNGIVGRAAASFEDYKYGKDLVAAKDKGLVWDEENLKAYLEDPRGFLRTYLENDKAKSKMSFKLKKEQERLDVVAYLKSLSE